VPYLHTVLQVENPLRTTVALYLVVHNVVLSEKGFSLKYRSQLHNMGLSNCWSLTIPYNHLKSIQEEFNMSEIKVVNDEQFQANASLSFQCFQNVQLLDKQLTLLHIESSTILKGKFQNTNLYNSSFYGVKLLNTEFHNVDWSGADICSIWAKDCVFENVNFDDDTISDSTFSQCYFKQCSFKTVTMTTSQFTDCTFEGFPIDNATVLLNTFVHCNIQDTNFTASFYYQIFEDCTFQKIHLKSSLLGSNFGIFPYEFLGMFTDVEIADAERSFISSGQLVNAAILKVNLAKDYYDIALLACITAMREMLQRDILVKSDEIQFLKNLSKYLEERRQIAPITLIQIWQILNSINSDENNAVKKALPHLCEFSNALYFSFKSFQKNLQDQLIKLPSFSILPNTVELKVVYEVAPSIPLISYLQTIYKIVCPCDLPPKMVRTERGSFIEVLQIGNVLVPYVQTFLSLLGVVIPIILHKKQNENMQTVTSVQSLVSSQDKTTISSSLGSHDNESSDLSETNVLPHTVSVSVEVRSVLSDTVKMILTTDKLVDYNGYNKNNIKEIELNLTTGDNEF